MEIAFTELTSAKNKTMTPVFVAIVSRSSTHIGNNLLTIQTAWSRYRNNLLRNQSKCRFRSSGYIWSWSSNLGWATHKSERDSNRHFSAHKYIEQIIELSRRCPGTFRILQQVQFIVGWLTWIRFRGGLSRSMEGPWSRRWIIASLIVGDQSFLHMICRRHY